MEGLTQQNQSNEWEGLYFEKEKIYFAFHGSDKRATVMVGLLLLGHYKLVEKGNFVVNSKTATLLYPKKTESEMNLTRESYLFWNLGISGIYCIQT